ncbi:MAG: DNA-formamidopyrimidine glycosylase family protein [Planctomycetota bacterium]
MPEGDTIHRCARRIARALVGHEVSAVEVGPAEMRGARIVGVEARGKLLLVHGDPGPVLVGHLGMTGAWHLYRPGERWRKPRRQARLVLRAGDFDLVCFTPKFLLALRPEAVAGHPALRGLGPDILADDWDPAVATSRVARDPSRSLGEALLDQSGVAGIGNIFKSESLFAARLDPFRPVGDCDAETLGRLLATARELMLPCVATETRTLRRAGAGRERHWVYERSGRPCLACGERVAMRRQGDAGRSTYFCPRCQS